MIVYLSINKYIFYKNQENMIIVLFIEHFNKFILKFRGLYKS